MIRLPFAPLEDAVSSQNNLNRRATNSEIMMALGIRSERTINKYRHNGLSLWAADRYAISLGVHPIFVWGLEAWSPSDEEMDHLVTDT